MTLNPKLGRAQSYASNSTLTIEQAVDVLDHYRNYVVHAPARDTVRRAGRAAEFGLLLIGADVGTQALLPFAREHVRTRFGADSAELARQAFRRPLHFGAVSRVGTAVIAGSVVYAGVRFVAIGLSRLFGRPALPDEAQQMRKYLALPKRRQLELAHQNPRLAAAVIELAEIMRGLPAYTPVTLPPATGADAQPLPEPAPIPQPAPQPSSEPAPAPAPNDESAQAGASNKADADLPVLAPGEVLKL